MPVLSEILHPFKLVNVCTSTSLWRGGPKLMIEKWRKKNFCLIFFLSFSFTLPSVFPDFFSKHQSIISCSLIRLLHCLIYLTKQILFQIPKLNLSLSNAGQLLLLLAPLSRMHNELFSAQCWIQFPCRS